MSQPNRPASNAPTRSRSAAIKAKCIECMGGVGDGPRLCARQVRECSALHCPLYAFRPFQLRPTRSPRTAEAVTSGAAP